jgi:hypothetical protein
MDSFIIIIYIEEDSWLLDKLHLILRLRHNTCDLRFMVLSHNLLSLIDFVQSLITFRFLFTCDCSPLIKSEVLLGLAYALTFWRNQVFLASVCLDRLLNAGLVHRYYESIGNMH